MKFGTQTRAAAFLVYEYKFVKNLGKIISLNDDAEISYFTFEDEVNKGQTINVVYNDINFLIFNNAYNSVEDLSQNWREFNKKYNPKYYPQHMEQLISLQKNTFSKNGTTFNLEDNVFLES